MPPLTHRQVYPHHCNSSSQPPKSPRAHSTQSGSGGASEALWLAAAAGTGAGAETGTEALDEGVAEAAAADRVVTATTVTAGESSHWCDTGAVALAAAIVPEPPVTATATATTMQGL